MSSSPPVPSGDRLLSLIEAMAGQPVLMLVDLVADRFITGTPKRISREAPVLILDYEGEAVAPGGGANAVANVAALGGRPLPLGVVGEDASGSAIRTALEDLGVETAGILSRAGYRTPTKTRILGGGRHSIKQQIVRFDIEDHLVLEQPEEEAFVQVIERWGVSPRVAVVSDYGYGTAGPDHVATIRAAIGAEGIILGDSRYRLGEFQGLDGATPNEEEAETLLGRTLNGHLEDIAPGIRELRSALGARFLLVTRGRHGMVLGDGEGVVSIPVHGGDQVADVTGAGDTVIGTFALALAAGATPLEAALLADYAGGIVVMKMGTATVSADELAAAVGRDDRPREGALWARS